MKTTISTFKPRASYPEQAIVMIFDLEGFSQFFSQPDVQEYVPQFLNIVLEAIDISINGGHRYWMPEGLNAKPSVTPLPAHIHSKFLGDGALFIWRYKDFNATQLASLINRLFNLKYHFPKIVKSASEKIPVIDIPQKIRFGVTAGSVYKLTYDNSSKEEFIGYCINLASRLQNYCKDIGFIVSARVNIDSSTLEANKYLKKVAKNIKGFPKEYVIIDKSDYNSLSEELQNDLFE